MFSPSPYKLKANHFPWDMDSPLLFVLNHISSKAANKFYQEAERKIFPTNPLLFFERSVFRNLQYSRIQIPSGSVLPTSLLRKEIQIVAHMSDAPERKNRSCRGLINRSSTYF